jgi:hypothetical protein
MCNVETKSLNDLLASAQLNLKQLKKTHPVTHRVITLPYSLTMNFLGCMDNYELEHKEKYKSDPEWYMYSLFVAWSLWYMCKSANTLITQYTRMKMRPPIEHVRHVSNTLLEVDYVYKNKAYQIRLPVSTRFSHQFVSATNRTNEAKEETDVSVAITKFLGPNEDWNLQSYTPKTLGFDILTISVIDQETLECKQRCFTAEQQLVPLRQF